MNESFPHICSTLDKKKFTLVLGAAGFIGKHLVKHLKEIRLFDSLILAGYGIKDKFALSEDIILDGVIDECLLRQCPKPNVIFFIAGSASVGSSLLEPAKDFTKSIPPLIAVLEKIRKDWHSTLLIFVSSAAVYGAMGSFATSVSNLLEPISPYGLHKKMSEELIIFACRHHDLNAVILRPFSVYGPGLRKQLLWEALRKADKGDYRFFGTGREARDWIYVSDFVSLLVDIAKYYTTFPQILNAGTGKGTTVVEMLRILFRAYGIHCEPIFNGDTKPGDPDCLVANTDEQAPYSSYFSTSLEDGLSMYVNWYRKLMK